MPQPNLQELPTKKQLEKISKQLDDPEYRKLLLKVYKQIGKLMDDVVDEFM